MILRSRTYFNSKCAIGNELNLKRMYRRGFIFGCWKLIGSNGIRLDQHIVKCLLSMKLVTLITYCTFSCLGIKFHQTICKIERIQIVMKILTNVYRSIENLGMLNLC